MVPHFLQLSKIFGGLLVRLVTRAPSRHSHWLFFSTKLWLPTVFCGSASALSGRLLTSWWRKVSSSCREGSHDILPIKVCQGDSGTAFSGKGCPNVGQEDAATPLRMMKILPMNVG